jgi:hypothetical protein
VKGGLRDNSSVKRILAYFHLTNQIEAQILNKNKTRNDLKSRKVFNWKHNSERHRISSFTGRLASSRKTTRYFHPEVPQIDFNSFLFNFKCVFLLHDVEFDAA